MQSDDLNLPSRAVPLVRELNRMGYDVVRRDPPPVSAPPPLASAPVPEPVAQAPVAEVVVEEDVKPTPKRKPAQPKKSKKRVK